MPPYIPYSQTVQRTIRKSFADFQRTSWSLFALMSVMASFCLVLFFTIFDQRLRPNVPGLVVLYGCDFIYLVDTIWRMKAFKQLMDRVKVYRRYKLYKTLSFLVDFVSILPFEAAVIAVSLRPQESSMYYLLLFSSLRLNRLLRLYRVSTYYSGRSKELRLNLYRKELMGIIVCFFCFLVVLIHGCACLWYAINCTPVWMQKKPQCKGNNSTNLSQYFHNGGHGGGSDAFRWYVVALHWTVMSIRNSGTWFTPPKGALDMAITCAIMVIGYVASAVITLFLIYILSELDLRRSIFFHEAYAVKSFVKHFEMGKSVAKFSDVCFNFMWRRKRGYSDNTMKALLPKAAQIEMSMCMIQPLVEISEILRLFSEDTLEAISLDARMKHFFANEFLIRPNTLVRTCFYIVSGKVEVLSETDGITPILLLAKGSLIGEINLIYPGIRKNGVKTRTPCDVIMVNSSLLSRLLKELPEIEEKIRLVIRERVGWSKALLLMQAKNNVPGIEVHEEEVDTHTSEPAASAQTEPLPTELTDVPPTPTRVKSITSRRTKLSSDASVVKAKIDRYRHVRRATGTQFMSVLAWLSFLKDETVTAVKNGAQKLSTYERLKHRWRNEASARMYSVDDLGREPKMIRQKFRLALSTESTGCRLWEAFVILIVLLNTIFYPIELLVNSPTFSYPMNIFVEFVYWADLGMRLAIFVSPEEMSPLTSLWYHVKSECRQLSIIVDIIPIIPVHHIALATTFVRNFRVYVLLRLHLHVKFLKIVFLFQRFENDVRVRIFTVRFFKNSFYISLYLYWLAVIFYVLGCPQYPNCTPKDNLTWIYRANNSVFYKFDVVKDSAFVMSFFWALSTTFGIGVLEIDIMETVIHSTALILGFCMLAYFYADLASTLSGALENAIHHQDNVIWLTRYLDEALIDLRLIDRVSRYLDTQWQALRGISSEANRSIGFLTVSHSMYIELLVDYVADFLYRTHLFRYLDTDTMRKFCLAAKLAVVAPNEVIICHGDFIRRMYVIRRGYVQVFVGDTTTTIGVLSRGHSFGEINMLFGIPSHVTLRSLTYLEVIIIDHLAFERILPSAKYFAEAVEVLRKNADGLSQYQRRFIVQPGKHSKKLRNRAPQAIVTSVYKYRKAIKNSKGQIINLRKLKNDPYMREFNRIRCGRYLRYFFMPMTFLPKGQFIRAWELVRVVFILMSAILIPLIEAFPSLKNEAEHYMYIFDLIALVDIFIRCHTAYHDTLNNELKTHPLLAAKHYLSSSFLIDFLASFPVYLLINYSVLHTKYETSVLSYIFRCNRILLLYRVFGYYKYKDFKVVKGKNTWKTFKLLPLLMYQSHVLACLLAVVTCPATQKVPSPDPRCGTDTWLYRGNSPGWTPSAITDTYIYITAFYYIATITMGCGFGDYHPYDESERLLFTCIMYNYIFLRAYIIANVVGSKCHMDYKFLGYQKQMSYLVGFLGREKLDYRLTSRIIRYYDYQWRRTQGIEPQKLFSNLFPSLRKEVAMDVFEDVLRQLPELKRVPPSFLRAICVFLTPIYFLRHDIIVQKDDVCDIIYFISRGKVLEWREDGEAYLQVGDYIGSMDVGQLRPVYKYTASAVTNVDIFGIRRKDYVRIVNFYPSIARKFQMSQSETDEQDASEAVTPRSAMHRSHSSVVSHADFLMVEHANKRTGSAEIMRQSLSEVVALVVEEDKKDDKIYDEDTMYAASVMPESPIYRYLDILTFVAAAISSVITCYQWTFGDVNYVYFSVAYVMDVVYVVRMALSFRVSYFDDSGEIVSDSSEIQNKYLSDILGFGLDFLSTFPAEIFVASFALQKIEVAELKLMWTKLRINRLLRLVHVWQFFAKRSNSLTNSLVRTKLERLTCFTLLYFHFLACGLHGVSTWENYNINCTKSPTDTQRWACTMPEHWYQTKESIGDFPEHPYYWSMYFILSTFTTTAYGDILAVDYFEKLLTSFVAFSSLIWFGLVLSDLLSGLQNTVDTSYHLAADVVLKMYGDYGVSSSVLDKIFRYFTYAWTQNKGVLIPEFLSRAPACLKMDICTVAYGVHIRTSYLFRNLPEEFIRQATIRLEHFWVLAGDYVVRQNEIDSNLYFIHRGYVEYTKESGEGAGSVTEIGYLGRSAFFGEFQCLLSPEPHEYSYKAQVNLDIVSLTPGDMLELFELFPQHEITVLRRINARKRNRLAAESQKELFGIEEHLRLKTEWDTNRLLLHDLTDEVVEK